MKSITPVCLIVLALALAACSQEAVEAPVVQDTTPAAQNLDWALHGGDAREQHYSLLDQINTTTVAQLAPAWSFDFDTQRGQEGHPIIVDGVLYISTAWSKVYALDAATGAEIWKFDPEVPGAIGPVGCCDVVNRGVAVDQGRVFVAALDGRLIALDAKTGAKLWDVDTVTNHDMGYTSTGAPRVAKGLVFIGQGGAERGVRGYISAFHADTGENAWRFYIVPGEPGVVDGEVSDDIIEQLARPTWSGDSYWSQGGGGSPWDSIVYDEELDQLYVGTGNGAPHSQFLRSAGEGDNLFLASILALDPDTGEYLWHYQQTPGDSWDYTSVQQMTLSDLEIDGVTRKVILHAPKNGFFYVVDRHTGVPISATPFVDDIRWASGIDPQTWRPIEVEGSRYETESFLGSPHVGGAHNWQAMAFSPQTGLVYIPTTQNYFWFNAVNANQEGDSAFFSQAETPPADNYLQALDPLTGAEVWRVDANGWEEDSGGGGVLVTAGNLVFQGRGDITGEFLAIRADNGEVLWRHETPNAVMAAPATYMIDGEQYIAVSTGGGGGGSPLMGTVNPPREQQPGRMIAFKLNGSGTLPPAPPLAGPAIDPQEEFDPARVAQGAALYANCMMCHGVNGRQSNIITDLRRSPMILSAESFRAVVHDGALLDSKGMPAFAGQLTPDQVESIRHFMGAESQQLAENQRAGIPER